MAEVQCLLTKQSLAFCKFCFFGITDCSWGMCCEEVQLADISTALQKIGKGYHKDLTLERHPEEQIASMWGKWKYLERRDHLQGL